MTAAQSLRRSADIAETWARCAQCGGLGYAPFNAWDHSKDVRCNNCDGRGGRFEVRK